MSTAVKTAEVQQDEIAPPLVRRKFTVHEYHQMAEAGILTEDDRVELIEGEIIEMSPIGGRHIAVVSALAEILITTLGKAARIDVQSPIRLDGTSEPEPDISVVRRRRYGNEVPNAGDVFLLIEVSDTTLVRDRNVKLPAYAAAGIPEVWIVDIQSEQILQFTGQRPISYRTVQCFQRGQQVVTEAVASVALSVSVDEVFA